MVVGAATDKFAILALTAGLTQTVPIAPRTLGSEVPRVSRYVTLPAKTLFDQTDASSVHKPSELRDSTLENRPPNAIMPRKPHTKSRTGCVECKRRHVKVRNNCATP